MVIWDMRAIASIGTPRALELFHKVLLASSAIPVALSPVLFEVEAGGERYDEMHVDGGVATQAFGSALLARELKDHPAVKGKIYIIYNEKLIVDPGTVKQNIAAMAVNSVNMMIASQGLGDLFRMYESSRENGLDFNLAYMPLDFNVPQKGNFDPVYMNALFDIAYSKAKSGYPWSKEPQLLGLGKS